MKLALFGTLFLVVLGAFISMRKGPSYDRFDSALLGGFIGLLAGFGLMAVMLAADAITGTEKSVQHNLVGTMFVGSSDKVVYFTTSSSDSGSQEYFYHYSDDNDTIVSSSSNTSSTTVTLSSETPTVTESYTQCLEWYCWGIKMGARAELLVPAGTAASN